MSNVPVIVTEEEIKKAVAYLRNQAAISSDVQRLRSEDKSLRNSDGKRRDSYSWSNPEQTQEWKIADLIDRIAATSTLQDQVEAYREALEAEDAYWVASRACAAAFARIRPQAEDNLAAAMARRTKARATLTQQEKTDAG